MVIHGHNNEYDKSGMTSMAKRGDRREEIRIVGGYRQERGRSTGVGE